MKQVFAACALMLMLLPLASGQKYTEDDEKQFSAWSAAVNIGPLVNSPYYDACPTISKSGLSLYFRSNRPDGQGGFDI
jgi:hypothetical protein